MLCISIYQKKSSLIISTWRIKLYLTLPMMLDHVYIYVYIFYPHIFNLLFNKKKQIKHPHTQCFMDQLSWTNLQRVCSRLYMYIYTIYIYIIHIYYTYYTYIIHILLYIYLSKDTYHAKSKLQGYTQRGDIIMSL